MVSDFDREVMFPRHNSSSSNAHWRDQFTLFDFPLKAQNFLEKFSEIFQK